jgi:hypothetical protein
MVESRKNNPNAQALTARIDRLSWMALKLYAMDHKVSMALVVERAVDKYLSDQKDEDGRSKIAAIAFLAFLWAGSIIGLIVIAKLLHGGF